MPTESPPGHGRHLDAGWALGLVVLAAVLRARSLGPSSLWLDDAWVALASRADLAELPTVGATALGFAAVEWALAAVAGSSSLVLQLVPFVAGILGPAAVYVVARSHDAARWAAVAAAALLVTSPVSITYAGRVKPYSLDTLLALLVVAAAWRVLERPADGRRAAWLGVAAVVALVVSGATALTVAPAVAVVAFSARRSPGGPALRAGAGIGAFGGMWWLLVLRPATSDGLRDYWSDFFPSTNGGPAGVVTDLGGLLVDLIRGFTVVAPWPALVGLAACVALVARRRPLVAALLAGPTVTTAIAATLQIAPLGGGRTDAHLYGSLALLVAVGLHEGGRSLARAHPITVVAPATAGALAAALMLVAWPPPRYPAEDVRPLVTILEESVVAGDAVLVYSATRWAYALYTSGAVGLVDDESSLNGFDVVPRDPRVTILDPHRDDPARHAPAVAAAVTDAARVWLLSSHETPDIAGVEAGLVAAGFERRATVERRGARLSRWERAPAG